MMRTLEVGYTCSSFIIHMKKREKEACVYRAENVNEEKGSIVRVEAMKKVDGMG